MVWGVGRSLPAADPGADAVVEFGGEFVLAVVVGVLVDEGRAWCALAHADHEVFEAGVLLGEECVTGVAQVVEGEVRGQVRDVGAGRFEPAAEG